MAKKKIIKEFGKWINTRTKRPMEGEDVIIKGNFSSHSTAVSVGHWVHINGQDKYWYSIGRCSSCGDGLLTRIDDEVEFWMPLLKYNDVL